MSLSASIDAYSSLRPISSIKPQFYVKPSPKFTFSLSTHCTKSLATLVLNKLYRLVRRVPSRLQRKHLILVLRGDDA